MLAQLDQVPGLERIVGLNRVDASLQTVDGWRDFPRVADGASQLFLEALGDAGRHARALVGVERLPGNVPVALVVTATVREGGR